MVKPVMCRLRAMPPQPMIPKRIFSLTPLSSEQLG
jgi:hypothetical protein